MTQMQKKKPFLRQQPAMRKVLLATLPCVFGSVYYFGWRSLVMILFCCAWGIFLEWLFSRHRKEPVSEAVLVTAVLFALVMPPGVGWHVLAVGMAGGVFFFQGGFCGVWRNNFYSPPAGRWFFFFCFSVSFAGMWGTPAGGGWGGFGKKAVVSL
ncbi:MAG: RnfABCDGE type electron transport complex subunit D [Planctomycetes bacterium]|nr:RnfABCDGE type electron transport complex subunit D [Planctomycetota bacterium]